MEPVTDETRNAAWDTLCDLEWNRRYYSAMADSYRRRQRWLRFTILAGVMIEAATLYAATMHGWMFYIAAIGGLLLTVLTIWDAVADYAENAAILRVTAFVCDDLNRETAELWRSVASGRIAIPDSEIKLKSVTDRWATATQRVIPRTNHRLNRKHPPTPTAIWQAVMPSDPAVGQPAPRHPGPPRPPDQPRPQPPPRPVPPRESEPIALLPRPHHSGESRGLSYALGFQRRPE